MSEERTPTSAYTARQDNPVRGYAILSCRSGHRLVFRSQELNIDGLTGAMPHLTGEPPTICVAHEFEPLRCHPMPRYMQPCATLA